MELRELVSLGGLLHDIGKPVQRAGFYSGDHPKQGAEFLRELARSTGREEYKLLALFSEFHHQGYMNETEMRKKISEVRPERFGLGEEDVLRALWIVYEADNLSSAEREEGKPEQIRPLYSIFNREKGYPPVTLEFGRELPVPGDIESLEKSNYERVVNGLREDLKKVELRVDRILPVLEKHLTFVSSATAKGNVISLYDHMRMTSAIALAMLNAGCTAEDVATGRCKREKRFLLIEGDLSGIQDFIYEVSGKGTLKYLRARSAYLELISWDIILEVLNRLGLTRANVIFNAGGHFLILAQNTEGARKELESIRKHVVEWLYREFDGKLYLALDWEAVGGEELGRKGDKNLFAEARKRLKEKLNIRKLRRFCEVEDPFRGPEAGERLEECAVCGKEVPESELEPFRLGDDPSVKVCRTCNELVELGKELPKVKGFILDRKAREGEGITKGPFRHFIPYVGEQMPMGEILLLKNTLDVPGNLPGGIEFVPYLVADYFKPSAEDKYAVADFEELAENSTGTRRLGVLKGDVDNLGLFFMDMDSPSKLATASRFMDYFFKAYLNEVIKGKFEYLMGEIPSLGDWPKEPDVVVVYAGGDDLFIVGAWDQVFELAFRIREAFRAYTGNGRSLSAALGYFHPKTPIYRMADAVSGRLEKAKREGRDKDRVFVIERTAPRGFPVAYRWKQYEELWKAYKPRVYAGNGRLAKELESKKSLLWRVLELRELYVRDPKGVKWAYLIAYLLGRHKLSSLFPELVGIDAGAALKGEPQPIYWVDGVLKVVLMAVRG
ncbi:type III-A CRISPR-associated protein Cas10/Csm1 [Thermococcus zilligii]|uniref:type III-A CRISPR-associated protein Cas10/Csm1 n=1 Tax=Thermococcus zilligii TaxID=54076 RepID=UPI00029AA025|nr:type III-A CRISPR-associated protein Cas10/Csm1 [Thermococcus zilligii]